MWDRLEEQVGLQREQLRRLIETHGPLLEKCSATPPNPVELSALAAMLHSFYNGIENIFKRIAAEMDNSLPSGEFWHQELLDAMAKPTAARTSVISPTLRFRLKECMEFRHVFRHAYVFDLGWARMRPLVLGCEETLRLLEEQPDAFLISGPAGGE